MSIRLAASTLTFTRLPLVDALARLAAMGFRYIDVGCQEGWAHLNPSEVAADPLAAARRLSEALAEHGLEPVALNAGFGPCPPDVARERAAALGRLAALCRIPIVTLPPPPNTLPLAAAADAIRPLVEAIGSAGVQPTVETHVDGITETPEAAIALCRAVPGLALTFDPTHFVVGPARGQFGDVLTWTRHVHLRDSGTTRAAIQVPIGEGVISAPTWLQTLRTAGYEGAISTEVIDSIGAIDADRETRRLHAQLAPLCDP